MFLCGGTLTYFAFDKKLFTGDLIFIGKFFIGLIVLITIGLCIYVIFKFRIIIVANNKIVSLYPFWFKKKKVDLNKIKKLKLENFFAFKGTVYRITREARSQIIETLSLKCIYILFCDLVNYN